MRFKHTMISGGIEGDAAVERLRPPAVLLLVIGVADVVTTVFAISFTVFRPQLVTRLLEKLEVPAEDVATTLTRLQEPAFRLFVLVIGAILVGMYLAAIVGALKMYRGESYRWSVAASALALLPPGSCACLRFLIGIWALVLLTSPAIRAGFRRN